MASSVVAEATVLIEILEVGVLGDVPAFSEGELAYAASKADPERRLAARLAAKQAACRALGGGVALADVEIVRAASGAPRLRLAARAAARLSQLGATGTRVSLTHGRTHAAAVVLLVREAE